MIGSPAAARSLAKVAVALFALLNLPPGFAQMDCVQWRDAIEAGASGTFHGMAFDSRRGVVVRHGGLGAIGGYWNDTLEYDGAVWLKRTMHAPNHAHCPIAYDSARGVTVLYTGESGSPPYATWEWDGQVWRLKAVGPQLSDSFHGLTYDAARGVTVMFGGWYQSNTDSSETWTWNGESWRLASTQGPSARDALALAYDEQRAVVVCFGGWSAATRENLGDTWEWDGDHWTQVAAAGPPARIGHAMAYDSWRDVCVLFGGGDYVTRETFGDTWEWNGSTWTQRQITGPAHRVWHAMAFDSIRGTMVLSSGSSGFTGGAKPTGTYELDEDGWTEIFPDVRPPLYGAGLVSGVAYDEHRDIAVLVYFLPNQANVHTFEFDGRLARRVSTSGPASRLHSGVAYDGDHSETLLFGGQYQTTYRDTWAWNGAEWVLRNLYGPANSSFPSMAYDQSRGKSVLAAGAEGTWEWSGLSWTRQDTTWTTALGKLAYHPLIGAVVALGQVSGGQSGLSSWSGQSWTWLSDGLASDGLLFDSSAEKLFAIVANSAATRVYSWTGNSWQLEITAGPGSRLGGGNFFYATAQQRWYLVNRDGQVLYLAPADPVDIVDPPQDRVARTGSNAWFSLAAAGSIEMSYQWRRDGVPLEDDGRILGSDTAVLRLEPVLASDCGSTFDCIVSNMCSSQTSAPAALTVQISGDIDHDGLVGAADLAVLLASYATNTAGDLNADDVTDAQDLAILLSDWGRSCP